VSTNDPAQPNVQLRVSATVKIALGITPTRLNFGQIRKGAAPARFVSLTGDDALTATILAATARSPHVIADINPEGFQNDKTRQLKISLTSDLPVGRFREQVTITTDHPAVNSTTLYLYGEVLGAIAVTPAYVSFGTLPHGTAVEKSVTVTATGDTTFAVLSVASAEPEVQTSVETVREGKEYKILVRVSEQLRKPFVRGTLTIRTDNTEQETIEVRYFGKIQTTPAGPRRPEEPPAPPVGEG
jgi:hypothetical protein